MVLLEQLCAVLSLCIIKLQIVEATIVQYVIKFFIALIVLADVFVVIQEFASAWDMLDSAITLRPQFFPMKLA
jgi:hypothetical protein